MGGGAQHACEQPERSNVSEQNVAASLHVPEPEPEQQRSVGSARCRAMLEPEPQHSVVCKCGRPLRAAMPVDEAQRSRVAPLPALLDAADIERIHECAALAQRRCECDDRVTRHPDGRWSTLYLQRDGLFERQCSGLLEKILRRVRAGEAREPTMACILTEKDESSVGVRCIEYHEVRPGGSLPDPRHHDVGSLVTIDILLSEPGKDFTGGAFTTLEADGATKAHDFGGRERSVAGDGLLFVSHKYHSVQAVISGVRRVLVIELWVGPNTTCNHRCNSAHACSQKDNWNESEYSSAILALSECECGNALRELGVAMTEGSGQTARGQLLAHMQKELRRQQSEEERSESGSEFEQGDDESDEQ